MNDESIISFGKYKGEKLANIPPDYLIWLFDNGKCFGDLKKYIAENMDVLRSEIEYKNKSK
jgi:uncharacterized protein (DUF3820 family)